MAEEKKKRKRPSYTRHLGSHVWLIIQGRYEKGDTVRAMAKEYGITAAAICNKAKLQGWLPHGQLKDDAVIEAREKIKEEVGLRYGEMAKQAVSNHYKLFRYVQQLALKLLNDVDNNSKEIDASKKKQINREIYQLNILAQTIKCAVDGERLTLGMDKMVFNDEIDGLSKFTEAIEAMRQKVLPEKIGDEEIEVEKVEVIEGEEGDIEIDGAVDNSGDETFMEGLNDGET